MRIGTVVLQNSSNRPSDSCALARVISIWPLPWDTTGQDTPPTQAHLPSELNCPHSTLSFVHFCHDCISINKPC
ncbi:hypothetical protein GJAV_G00049540, partial [Gymnothorax javanicus]